MIRPAQIDDGRELQRLLEQLEYPDTGTWIKEKLERMLADPNEVLLVWEETGDAGAEAQGEETASGRISGFLSLHFIPQIGIKGDFARISYFAVDGEARSQGIGRAMEERAVVLARERGCYLLEVHCHQRRERAHAFYFRQGYKESPKYLIKKL